MIKSLAEIQTPDVRTKLSLLDLHQAIEWRKGFEFITDDVLLRNISYQLQYLDFLIELHNKYQIYGVIDSLLCKNIIVNINSIVEACLDYTARQAMKKSNNLHCNEQIAYVDLINMACEDFGIISTTLVKMLHQLRKQRNFQHFQSQEERELDKYKPKDANYSIEILKIFRDQLKEYYNRHLQEDKK